MADANYISLSNLAPLLNSDSTQQISILHCNIVNLNKNINKLEELLMQISCKPNILCISETKLRGQNSHLPGYNFIQSDSSTNAGGVGMFIDNSSSQRELTFSLH